MLNDIIAVKDHIVEKICAFAETIDLQDKVSACKKKLASAKRDLKKAVKSLKEKNIGDCISCVVPAKEEKKNPVVAVIGAISAVVLVFILMVALFYGIFCLLDNKKKCGYHTIKF